MEKWNSAEDLETSDLFVSFITPSSLPTGISAPRNVVSRSCCERLKPKRLKDYSKWMRWTLLGQTSGKPGSGFPHLPSPPLSPPTS